MIVGNLGHKYVASLAPGNIKDSWFLHIPHERMPSIPHHKDLCAMRGGGGLVNPGHFALISPIPPTHPTVSIDSDLNMNHDNSS